MPTHVVSDYLQGVSVYVGRQLERVNIAINTNDLIPENIFPTHSSAYLKKSRTLKIGIAGTKKMKSKNI